MTDQATSTTAAEGRPFERRVRAHATDGDGFLALAAALLGAGGTRPADDVRLVGGRTLRAMGFEVPPDDWVDWGLAVRSFRARGLLIEDYHAGVWAPGSRLADGSFRPPGDWLNAACAAWADMRPNVRANLRAEGPSS